MSIKTNSTYAVVNLGCKVNRVESDEFERIFNTRNWHQVPIDDADIIVVNTCAVTGAAEKKTRKCIRGIVETNSNASIFVTGCASALNESIYLDMSDRIKVIPKLNIDSHILQTLNSLSKANLSPSSSLSPEHESERYRRGIKIQDGCSNECTYCIIWKARGKEYSVDANTILNRALELENSGVKEIILTGINIGKYFCDDVNLCDLLVLLLQKCENCRFRISSIEPDNVTNELIDLIASSQGRICRHLHIPLQSGSTRILSDMNRTYTSEQYKDLIKRIRTQIPNISITTDIIVGFPGETDFDFNQTCELSNECRFSKIHVFPFSSREGTLASNMKDQIPSNIKSERAKKLRDISDNLRKKDFKSRIGCKEICIYSGKDLCMSESYHEIPVPTDKLGLSQFELTL